MRSSKFIMSGLMAVAIALGLSSSSLAQEKENQKEESSETKITLQQCPTAVQQAAKAQAANGQIVGAEKYTESGQTVYEVKVKKTSGETVEIKMSSDGKVLSSKPEDEEEEKEERRRVK